MYQFYAKIFSNISISPTYYKMTLECSKELCYAKPGSFVLIRTSNLCEPLLRRPFVIYNFNTAIKCSFDIIYKIVGKGTKLMSHLAKEDSVNIIGPLGNGFDISSDIKNAVLVAGGTGIASMYLLAKKLILEKKSKVALLYGAKTNNDIVCFEDFKNIGVDVMVTTEDGSFGGEGLVTEIFGAYVKKIKPIHCFSAGPIEMLKIVSKICMKKDIQCQVSMESNMACGVGACLGCAVKVKDGFKLVCKDGPVFDAYKL